MLAYDIDIVPDIELKPMHMLSNILLFEKVQHELVNEAGEEIQMPETTIA